MPTKTAESRMKSAKPQTLFLKFLIVPSDESISVSPNLKRVCGDS